MFDDLMFMNKLLCRVHSLSAVETAVYIPAPFQGECLPQNGNGIETAVFTAGKILLFPRHNRGDIVGDCANRLNIEIFNQHFGDVWR